MSHLIYRTEAILLGDMPNGEDNRLYFLLTENLGFVMAVATGVRLLKSKLRHHLSLFALIEVELVRGKNIWRIVNAYPREEKIFFRNFHTPLFARLAGLVRRMVHGEEENRELFNEIKELRKLLSENNLSRDEENNLEVISVARVLYVLGYFEREKYGEILSVPASRETLSKVGSLKKDMLTDINLALNESQL